MTDWYYVNKDKQIGPFNSYEFDLLVIKGEIRDETLVWNSTMSDWQSFGSISYKPPAPELKKPELKRDSLNSQRRSDPATGNANANTLPSSIGFLGLLVFILTLHRVYIFYEYFLYMKFILKPGIPKVYLLFFVLSLIITGFWFVTTQRFIKKDKRFLSSLRKTAVLSCLPMVISIMLSGNFMFFFRLSIKNIDLIYLVIAFLSFTLMKKDKFDEYFKN